MDADAKIDKLVGVVRDTLDDVEKDRRHYCTRSQANKRLSIGFRASMAVLAVCAPALVTYQTTVQDKMFSLIAILLTGIAGAAATLQAIFNFGECYKRQRLLSLALEELHSNGNLDFEDAQREQDQMEKYHKLKKLNETLQAGRRRHVREYLEAEMALVTQKNSDGPTTPRAVQ